MAIEHRQPKERWALIGLVALALCACSYAVVKGLKQPSPVVFRSATSTEPAPLQAKSDVVVVHATGAVVKPGLLRLPADSRVADAIDEAGGSLPDADLESINLAAKLVDGTQVFVPHKEKAGKAASNAPAKPQSTARRTMPRPEISKTGGIDPAYEAKDEIAPPYRVQIEPDPQPASPSSAPDTAGGSKTHSGAKKAPSGPVHLNSATSAELQTLPGVGPATAQKIIDYRESHGGFRSVEELIAIKGIGEKKMAALRKWLQL